MIKRLTFSYFTLLLLSSGWSKPLLAQQARSERQYLALEYLCDRRQSPRLLNVVDVESFLDPTQNLGALISPRGDFDLNGIEDEALSGIYNLPSGRNRYFLLVSSWDPAVHRPKLLYFEEYEKPVFLFSPGATGRADPGDQAFSISHCIGCSEGIDFYWNSQQKKFLTKEWSTRIVHSQAFVSDQGVFVPEDVVDSALKIVGESADVVAFVNDAKSHGHTLATRVNSGDLSLNTVVVTILKKINAEETVFGTYTVDMVNKKIIDRARGQDALR